MYKRQELNGTLKKKAFALHVIMLTRKIMKLIGINERKNYKKYAIHIVLKMDLGM